MPPELGRSAVDDIRRAGGRTSAHRKAPMNVRMMGIPPMTNSTRSRVEEEYEIITFD